LDSKVFHEPVPVAIPDHDREVQTFTILKGAEHPAHYSCESGDECGGEGHEHREVEPIKMDGTEGVERSLLLDALSSLSKESVWRVKGFVRLLPDNQIHILNWAFGRYELDLCNVQDVSLLVRFTVMGKRGEIKRLVHRLAEKLGASVRA
jgi:hypothetical protein